MSQHTEPKRSRKGWYVLFVIPFIGTLFPQFYNQATPALVGLPFFYWYQLLWVVITGFLTFFVYLVTR